MNAVFTDLDVYLTELKEVKSPSIVRVSTEEVEPTQREPEDGGRGYGTQFVVVSSFHDDKYFYQGMFDAGIATGRVGNDKAERAKAAAMVEKIREACLALGVECRGGLWVRP